MTSSTPALPTTQTAIVANSSGKFIVSHNVPVTDLDPDAIIVKTMAVGLNPVDTKMIGDFVTPGAILGFDCAGTVVAVGSAVRTMAPGDRVCGSADGMNALQPHRGAFAEYTSWVSDLALRIPDSMSFESAAPLGTAVASAGMVLFHSLNIPASLDKPAQTPFFVLVYGGSTCTGTMAIQLHKLCNVRVIVTCSPKNFAFVKSFGAEEAFDYRSPTCAQDIKAYTKNTLGYAMDCITEEDTMKICYAAIGRAGGRYCSLDPFPEHLRTRKVVKPDWILATWLSGKGSGWPAPFKRDGDPALRAFGASYYRSVQKALTEGKIRPHSAKACPGGFEAILDGIDVLRRKEVSAEKLVYRLA